MKAYKEFTNRFKLFIKHRPDLIKITLSNIFTMRLIGNKTHGDLAEIAIAEFINQYMYDYESTHVGKDLYRAKSQEEDIKILSKISNEEFPVSLKAYGDGPLQLSTDKNFRMFPRLKKEGKEINNQSKIKAIFKDSAFSEFSQINILPLIYNEKESKCNILIFDYKKAKAQTKKIILEPAGIRGRKHPVYKFYGKGDSYICEVRYGDAEANALQRGLWTHTRKASDYFYSLTSGWVNYYHNIILLQLFSHALVSSEVGHKGAVEKIKDDIIRLQKIAGIKQ